jgi:hypothetical protein
MVYIMIFNDLEYFDIKNNKKEKKLIAFKSHRFKKKNKIQKILLF